ncbi:MAG: choice-of-anchor tandem repeat GloVer-containing protein, partial [Mycobacterium sp.]
MKKREFELAAGRLLALAAMALTLVASSWAASTETVLHTFTGTLEGGGPDGDDPTAGLIADAQGNLYGTTFFGGSGQSGIVFKLTHKPDGSYAESIIYTFPFSEDGHITGPAASLVFDSAGILYGTTVGGGNIPVVSDGTVFKLTPTKSGEWTSTILHSFNCTSANDGCMPYSSL